jgi:hypothetical protein
MTPRISVTPAATPSTTIVNESLASDVLTAARNDLTPNVGNVGSSSRISS